MTFGKRPLLPRTTKAKPKAKADVVGIVCVPHVDYGVIGVPCSVIGKLNAFSVERSWITRHARTLKLAPGPRGRKPDAYLTREEAEVALKSLLQKDLEDAEHELDEARREIAKVKERLLRIEHEGVRFCENHDDLYSDAPGPSAKTVEMDP